MAYPPQIDDAAMFPAAPAIAVVAACPRAQDTCSITSLSLNGHPAAAVSFDAAANAPLAAGAAGRYVMAPVVDGFPLSWTLAGHDRIRRLRLELYRRNDPQPFWWKELDYTGGGIAANGSTQFDGNLDNNAHAASNPASQITLGSALGGRFARQVLTAEHAPYKLLLRIQEVENPTRVLCPARWIYLDVMVHDIQLHLEGIPWLSPAAGAGYADQHHLALVTQTRADVDAQLVASDLGAAAGGITVPLSMNVFSRSSDDFYSNAMFTGKQRLYRNGPELPLRATLRIRRANGTPAAAQAGASALGGLGLLWDWESGVRPAHPNATAQDFITAALDYKPTEWPLARSNCHVDHGGKRGVNAQGVLPHFLALPAGTLAAPGNAIAAVANRPWAATSQPVADSAHADGGKAGILFQPSRIAGDTYRLRVYLGYPTLAAFDVAGALQGPANDSVSLVSAATLTVRHKVDVAFQWRKNGNINPAGLNWATVQGYLAAACIDLQLPPAGAQSLLPAHYQAAAQAHFATLDIGILQALDIPANQPNGEFALTFRDYATFSARIQAYGTQLNGLFGHMAFVNDAAFRAAQCNAVGLTAANRPNGYRGTDLILTNHADVLRSATQRRDLLLAGMGISDEDSYKEKCKSWGGTIAPALCGRHARTNSANRPGLHLYHFDFADPWFQYEAAAEASTTISNFATCPACATPTPTTVQAQGNRTCACGQRLDQSAIVTCYAPFRYLNGQIDAWAKQNLTFKQRSIIRAGNWYQTSAAITIAHEIGHHLGMPHAGPHAHVGPVRVHKTGGMYPPYHDAADKTCIMSYNFTHAPQLHFCGLCSLRLAGWSMGSSNQFTHQADHQQDQRTLPLSNQAPYNQARAPAPGAAWVSPDPAQCQSCNRGFGTLLRAHHCRLCGNVFCDDHSNHTRPVRNPLTPQPVSTERVCDTCHGLVPRPLVPDPSARWEPDENAWSCEHPGCTVVFSTSNRIHHCRACGKPHCAAHTTHREPVRNPLKEAGQTSQERVCDACDALYG